MTAHLIVARDLDVWAGSIEAKHQFPLLMRRLIHSSVEVTASVDIRTGEGVAYPGWDGLVTANQPQVGVPAGSSGWEFGCDEEVTTKANKDYQKRSEDPEGLDLASTTFVFATPRRWPGKHKWLAAKQAEGRWGAVCAFDADDLAAWLERLYPVHVWATALLDRPIAGIESIDRWLDSWSTVTDPPITTGMLLAGRQTVTDRVSAWFQGKERILTIVASSTDEACAVFAAAIANLPTPLGEQAKANTLRIASGQVDLFASYPAPCVIACPHPDADMARRILGMGHRFVLFTSTGTEEDENVILVPKLNPQTLAKILTDTGKQDRQAWRLAAIARRSFASFRRALAQVPIALAPTWAGPSDGSLLACVLLAQKWQADCDADCEVVAELIGEPYTTIEPKLAVLAASEDPPIRRKGNHWEIISAFDVWREVRRHITPDMLRRFHTCSVRVLGEADSKFDVSPEERWRAFSQRRRYSALLRSGLADSLPLLAANGRRVPPGSATTAESMAVRIARDLLHRCHGDERQWFSVQDILEELAETAPDDFLRVCEEDMDSAEPVLPRLYVVSKSGFMTSSPHVNLLWALEKLAWSPNYLARSACILAFLSLREPEGNYGNRAGNSLGEIFLSWRPHTKATETQRLQALDTVRQRSPTMAWTLMLSLLSGRHSSTGTSQPKWADWAPLEEIPVTSGQRRTYVLGIIDRLMSDAGTFLERLAELLQVLNSLPPEIAESLLTRLESIDPSTCTSNEKKSFTEKLRRLTTSHRRYPSAKWVFPNEILARLENQLRRFASQDLIDANLWLFAGHVELPTDSDENHEQKEQAILSMRIDVLRSIIPLGIPGLIRLAQSIDHPRIVGFTLGQAEFWDRTLDDELLNHIADLDPAWRGIAGGLACARWNQGKTSWLAATIARLDSILNNESKVLLLLEARLEPETWALVDKQNNTVADLYWQRVPIFFIPQQDVLEAVGRLIRVRRVLSAITVLGTAASQENCAIDAKAMLDLLTEAMSVEPAEEEKSDGHFGWLVEKLLEFLFTKLPDVEEPLATLEWQLSPALRTYGQDTPPHALHRRLKRLPDFFVEVLSLAYRGANEPERTLNEADRARALLAHSLLRGWRDMPGSESGRSVDPTITITWVTKARDLLHAADRAKIGDRVIGQVFSGCPTDPDGTWPCLVVRDLIQSLRSDAFEEGFSLGRFNDRGVTTRGVFDGGEQERDLAAQYQTWADRCAGSHPRAAALLRSMARSYEHDARSHDQDADDRLDHYG